MSAFGIIFMRRTTVRLYMDVILASLGSVFQTHEKKQKTHCYQNLGEKDEISIKKLYCLPGKVFDDVAIPETSSRVTLALLGSVFQTEKRERKKTSDIFNSVCVYKSGLSQCSVVDQQLYFFLRASSKLSDDSLFPQNIMSIPSSCNLK